MEKNEFYIGWMDKAPAGFVRVVRRALLMVLPLFLAVGLLLALGQKPFGTGNFELGTPTIVRGVYFSAPVPCLKIRNGQDILTMPLVGYGKHGAGGIIEEIERKNKVSLDRKEVTLKAILLYNDGKTVLQINPSDTPVQAVRDQPQPEMQPAMRDLGEGTIRGEIIDLKCYFGVMKPGEGKPHRDCAARCILGGMAPMLLVRDGQGNANYYLMTDGKDGLLDGKGGWAMGGGLPAGEGREGINEAVKNFVGEQVTVRARRVQIDDWVVLFVDGLPQKVSYLQLKYGDRIAACGH